MPGPFRGGAAKDPKNAQAYLGLAIVSADGFDGKATDYASRALVLDPKLVEAHEFAANLALENADTEDVSLRPMSRSDCPRRAERDGGPCSDRIAGEPIPRCVVGQSTESEPRLRRGYAHVAHYLELNYRFEDAIVYDRKAIEADPKYWPARSQLGVGLMRLGQEDEPFKQLEMCYNNGYRDAKR